MNRIYIVSASVRGRAIWAVICGGPAHSMLRPPYQPAFVVIALATGSVMAAVAALRLLLKVRVTL